MARRPGRKATAALQVLAAAGVEAHIHTFEHDPRAASFGAEAADALGLDPRRVLKTLVVTTGAGDLAAAVVPVSATLDLKATATALGLKRVALAEPRRAERVTGSRVGAISPIGVRGVRRVLLDGSALAHGSVLVSAGRRGLEVELDPHDLVRVCDALVVPIARE
ncbi:Cys-tRNA(Pro) deacylase [Aeromicrobium halocynthiae]|uniref:Cys-tRNA(Pro)/Cys-tRNA(Cys) deacylase n=1 Tax=Aeromicrobium halocynthiae TaxID=560557 RepID=A0ABN2VSD1_9ACTN